MPGYNTKKAVKKAVHKKKSSLARMPKTSRIQKRVYYNNTYEEKK